MSKTIRTKFNVAEIAKYGNGGGTKVTLLPMMDKSENKSLWESLPAGKIEIHISNPDAEFEFGEYYVDFTTTE